MLEPQTRSEEDRILARDMGVAQRILQGQFSLDPETQILEARDRETLPLAKACQVPPAEDHAVEEHDGA